MPEERTVEDVEALLHRSEDLVDLYRNHLIKIHQQRAYDGFTSECAKEMYCIADDAFVAAAKLEKL